jgi:hypothetical protein
MPFFRQKDKPMAPAEQAMVLNMTEEKQRTMIGQEEIRKAAETLQKYKQGKSNLEKRIIEDEMWWKLRHWEAIGRKQRQAGMPAPAEPTSAWLFNAILNKHADAMDNYPEPMVLPRERTDDESAKTLSSVLPVVLESNGFEETYDDNWWEKLKHGSPVYGVFWDQNKENGLGDIAIRSIDLLKVFWEPGVTDIQKSRNLFIVDLVAEDVLEQEYPQHKGKLKGDVITVADYTYDDAVDTSDKVVVVDWYYKRKTVDGRQILHYCKFVGDVLLYASENDPVYAQQGYYWHGKYPVHFDCLFPEKGTPVGFGYVAICKDPQLYIDKLMGNILDYADAASTPRWFISEGSGVNETEYLDKSKKMVHVDGHSLDETKIRQITMDTLPSIYANIVQMKIEEMKDTAANRDVNSGGAGSGVTAAAAITALQEAGNKASRDMISASYRCYRGICEMCVDLMRQFYDETRSFRITGKTPGAYEFVDINNSGLQDQMTGMTADGVPLYRKPVFDIKISAQRKNPFSRIEQNQRALELYSAGFFNPEQAQAAMGALEMMDFEGKDKVMEYVQQGQTLMNMVQQLSMQVQQLMALVPAAQPAMPATAPQQGQEAPKDVRVSGAVQAQRAPTKMQQQAAAKARPDMNRVSQGANPAR